MPVTARLSKRLYDRLGEEIANELVEWFNQVDSTSRADIRELNELNVARSDAKLEQRFARIEARMDGLATKESLTAFRADLEHALLVQTRWMFVAWASLMLTLVLRT